MNTPVTCAINKVAELALTEGHHTLTIPEHSGGISIDVPDIVVS